MKQTNAVVTIITMIAIVLIAVTVYNSTQPNMTVSADNAHVTIAPMVAHADYSDHKPAMVGIDNSLSSDKPTNNRYGDCTKYARSMVIYSHGYSHTATLLHGDCNTAPAELHKQSNPAVIVPVIIIDNGGIDPTDDNPTQPTQPDKHDKSDKGNPGNLKPVGNAGENPNGKGTMPLDNTGGNGNGEHGNQGANDNGHNGGEKSHKSK